MNSAALPVRHRTPRGGRRMLLLMGGMFAVPFVVVALLLAVGWRPAKPAHHGELLADGQAAREIRLPLAALHDADGRPLPADLLAGHWTLLVASGGNCTVDCQARLATVRRIHVALYKQMPRVKRVWLSPAPAADPALATLRGSYPDLVVASAPTDPAWRELMAADGPRFYVIDPAGRVVMRYPEAFDPRGALRDIEKLLKYSWIG